MANQRWGRLGRLSNCNKGEARRVGDRVHALPWAKRGNLSARHWNHPEPTRQCVPDPINV